MSSDNSIMESCWLFSCRQLDSKETYLANVLTGCSRIASGTFLPAFNDCIGVWWEEYVFFHMHPLPLAIMQSDYRTYILYETVPVRDGLITNTNIHLDRLHLSSNGSDTVRLFDGLVKLSQQRMDCRSKLFWTYNCLVIVFKPCSFC